MGFLFCFSSKQVYHWMLPISGSQSLWLEFPPIKYSKAPPIEVIPPAFWWNYGNILWKSENHWSKLTANLLYVSWTQHTLDNFYPKKSILPSRLMRKFPVLVMASDGKSSGRELVRVVREAIMSSVSWEPVEVGSSWRDWRRGKKKKKSTIYVVASKWGTQLYVFEDLFTPIRMFGVKN